MLNDVLSLCVGLWAVKVANEKSKSKMYTYGWQRAETLGALINGVFLVALCLSIFLEAIQRFVEPQTVSNPGLVFIVGCFGLLSNILGLFLFHEHGHSHGGHGHSHGAVDGVAAAEEGHSHTTSGDPTAAVADESGNVADVLPQSTVAGWPKSDGLRKASREDPRDQPGRGSTDFTRSDEEGSTATNSTSPLSMRKSLANGAQRRRRQNSGGSRSRFSSVDDIHIHPASFRNDIIAASRLEDIESRNGSSSGEEEAIDEENAEPTENSPLLANGKANGSAKNKQNFGHSHKPKESQGDGSLHKGHKHTQAKDDGGNGHSHSDLNMRGVFLHVMGDALGNIGVIGSALIIWGTDFSWRFYADPAISLVITIIILCSAIPLCKAASRILLQAVPAGISIDDVKADIEKLPGILRSHDLHVWQLSDVALIASLHVEVEYDFKGEGSARYMQLAHAIRHCLQGYGIYHCTIQPEFCLDADYHRVSRAPSDCEGPDAGSKGGSMTASLRSQSNACLLNCSDSCDENGQCRPSKPTDMESHNEEGSSH